MKSTERTSGGIGIQSWLRPALNPVGPNKDFHAFREQLEMVDGLLRNANLESMAMEWAEEGYASASVRQLSARKQFALKAVRVQALRMLVGNPSFREFSRMVAGSDLMADFCGVRRVDGIRGVAKSTLERASKFFDEEKLRWMHQGLVEASGEPDRAKQLGLSAPVETGEILVDSTCLEANIHYPSDWLLLRDVAGTLLKAVKLVRGAGLCQRMPEDPEAFARQMNRLCIEMTNTRRKPDAKKARKAVLRRMKPLLRTIGGHARRHRDRLEASWQQTRFSQAQARQVVERIDRMLALLPTVIEQAHERLIGERQVENSRKVLSVYEPDVNVLVRGKAGKEVEFGNSLMLAETTGGLIVDWQVYRKAAPAEWKQLQESLARQNAFDLSAPVSAVVTDRGFASKQGSAELAALEIFDATCPRDPQLLRERMGEERFARFQRRRGSTEARIAILRQRIDQRLRERGFEHRCLAVGWAVLGHNLWILARLLCDQRKLAEAA
jgi:hypothetical protein